MKGVKMMKIKFLALAAFMLCLSILLVSCGAETPVADEPEKEACTEIVDANNDNKCDNCGHVALVPEVVIPEMIVNPIPDSNANEYFSFPYEDGVVPVSKVETLTGGIVKNSAATGGRIIVLKWTQPISPENVPDDEKLLRDHYVVFDLETKKSVYTFATEEYISKYAPRDSYSFELSDYYFAVHKEVADYNPLGQLVVENTWIFRTNSGDPIATTYTLDRLEADTVGDVFYLTVNDTVYPIDTESETRLMLAGSTDVISGNADIFVKRPAFNTVLGNYGYVFELDSNDEVVGLQVYDLTKWLECIYSFDVASYVDGESAYMGVLQSGNVLMQNLIPLHDDVKAYDVIEGGVKYDMVYTSINPFDGTLTELEFGYYIAYIGEASATGIVADVVKAPNVAYVYPIVDDLVDRSQLQIFAVANDLKILSEHKAVLPAQYTADKRPVGNGLYVVDLLIGEKLVEAVIDEAGQFVTYLPENYYAGDGFIIAGKCIYGYDMKEIFKLVRDDGEYTVEHRSRGFLILAKRNFADNTKRDFFYYAPGSSAPIEIASERSGSGKTFYGMLGSGLFVIREAQFSEIGVTSYRYNIFNSKNNSLKILDREPKFVGEYNDAILANDDVAYYVFYN